MYQEAVNKVDEYNKSESLCEVSHWDIGLKKLTMVLVCNGFICRVVDKIKMFFLNSQTE